MNSSESGVVVRSMDSSYSRVVVSDVADSSVVVEVGVDVRLSLSLTLAVHVVETRVKVGVHRRNSYTTDNRSGDGVVGVVYSSMDSGHSSVVDRGCRNHIESVVSFGFSSKYV